MDLSPLYISIKVAVIATVITIFSGIVVAGYIFKLKKFKTIIDGILTLPMVLPPTVVGFFLIIIFGKNSIIGSMLGKLGISIVFTLLGAVLAAIVVSFPLMYRTLMGAFEQFDINIINAARTLGISEFKIFWRIIIPNVMPSIIAGSILTFARALGEFGATIMLAGNIPGKTQTIAVSIYTAVQAGNMQKAYTWVLIMFAMSFTAMIIMNLINYMQCNNIVKRVKTEGS